MPDDDTPTPRRIPHVEVRFTNLGGSYAAAVRDPESGLVTLTVGTGIHRAVFADDPGVLGALLSDALSQVLEVGRA